jgi:hypothetical protein
MGRSMAKDYNEAALIQLRRQGFHVDRLRMRGSKEKARQYPHDRTDDSVHGILLSFKVSM